jgi:hypothetical protein
VVIAINKKVNLLNDMLLFYWQEGINRLSVL